MDSLLVRIELLTYTTVTLDFSIEFLSLSLRTTTTLLRVDPTCLIRQRKASVKRTFLNLVGAYSPKQISPHHQFVIRISTRHEYYKQSGNRTGLLALSLSPLVIRKCTLAATDIPVCLPLLRKKVLSASDSIYSIVTALDRTLPAQRQLDVRVDPPDIYYS